MRVRFSSPAPLGASCVSETPARFAIPPPGTTPEPPHTARGELCVRDTGSLRRFPGGRPTPHLPPAPISDVSGIPQGGFSGEVAHIHGPLPRPEVEPRSAGAPREGIPVPNGYVDLSGKPAGAIGSGRPQVCRTGGGLTSLPAEAGRFFPRGLSFLLRSRLPTRTNGEGRGTAHRSYTSSRPYCVGFARITQRGPDITSRQPGGRPTRTWFSSEPTRSRLAPVPALVRGFGDLPGTNHRFPSCSTGARFLPSLKVRVSSEGSR